MLRIYTYCRQLKKTGIALTKSSKKRLKVLEYSLTMELMASFALSFLLDIDLDKLSESKSLGNSSSALSFSQKVNLLLDNKSITKNEKLKLESFMNIRNQFMHNKSADSYSKAISFIQGLGNRLKKIYPNLFSNKDKLEESYEKCVSQIFSDSLSILGDFKGGRLEKLKTHSERNVYVKKYNILKDSMNIEIDRVCKLIKDNESDLIDKKEIIQMVDLLKYEIILKSNK